MSTCATTSVALALVGCGAPDAHGPCDPTETAPSTGLADDGSAGAPAAVPDPVAEPESDPPPRPLDTTREPTADPPLLVVPDADQAMPPCEPRTATRVAVGGYHACAIAAGGSVYCWGHNDQYQLGVHEVPDTCSLGDSEYPCSRTPVRVPGLSGITDLGLSNAGSCAVDGDGVVYCWGVSQSDVLSDSPGELCDLSWADDPAAQHLSCSPDPVPIAGITHGVSLGAWGAHCATELDGRVLCWVAHMGRTPTPVPDVADAVQTDYTCAVTADGHARCWWCNDHGQRGDGTLAPAQRVGVPSNCELTTSTVAWSGTALQVSSGYLHACLVDADGSLACWGDNRAGQLGVPSTGPELCNGDPCATAPLRVPDIDGATQVAAGYGFTCVLHGAGAVACLGVGRGRIDVALPAPARQLAARYWQACAVLEDGRVMCWSPGRPNETAPREIPLCAEDAQGP